MKKIILIVGARPNYIKAFPVFQALKNNFKLTLINTGQHTNTNMSDIFFNQLGFSIPNIQLNLNSITKADEYDDLLYINNKKYMLNKSKVIEDLLYTDKNKLGQLGEIRDRLEKEFKIIKPDLVLLFGDITSTLAGGIAARKLSIKIAHIESGLRSGDLSMPEEVNRILTDFISNYYFVTEPSGIENLKNEGIVNNVYLVGNTMIDSLNIFKNKILDINYHIKLGLQKQEYILVTLHRPGNVDNLDKLQKIFDDLDKLSKSEILVYPIHPRTKKKLEKIGYLEKIKLNPNIILEEPLGYLEFTCLESNAKYVITDSGGVQEETTVLKIPCFTLRSNTERPMTLIENGGTNQLINSIGDIKLKNYKNINNKLQNNNIKLWDGNSSTKIFHIINLFEL